MRHTFIFHTGGWKSTTPGFTPSYPIFPSSSFTAVCCLGFPSGDGIWVCGFVRQFEFIARSRFAHRLWRKLQTRTDASQSAQLRNEYLVFARGEETAAQATVGAIVWAFRRLKKPIHERPQLRASYCMPLTLWNTVYWGRGSIRLRNASYHPDAEVYSMAWSGIQLPESVRPRNGRLVLLQPRTVLSRLEFSTRAEFSASLKHSAVLVILRGSRSTRPIIFPSTVLWNIQHNERRTVKDV